MGGAIFVGTPILPANPGGSGGGGGGSVTSFSALPSGIFDVADPTGDVVLSLDNQTTNKVLAAPNGSTGTPSFRLLVAADLPAHGLAQHSGNVLPADADQDVGDGSLTFGDRAAPSTPASGKAVLYLSLATGKLTVKKDDGSTVNLEGFGSGSVTSVALSLPAEFSVSGSPVTSSGTLGATWANQTTNKVFAAPNGSTGTPTFRTLVAADIPDLSGVYQPLDADLTSWAAITRASGFDTFVATPSSANLRGLLTDETGTGAAVFATSPTLVTPLLGTPTSGTLTNCDGLPEAGLTLADNTTANVSTTKHGFAPKAPNDATKFLDGTGAWTKPGDLAVGFVSLTDGATITVTASSFSKRWTDIGKVTLGGNRTLSFSGGTAGQRIELWLLQDGTGSRTLAYDSSCAFSTDIPSPTLTTTANKKDKQVWEYDDVAGKWHLMSMIHAY